MTVIERAIAAALAELHRQGEKHGCTIEDNGTWVQIDGSFKIEPAASARPMSATSCRACASAASFSR